MTVLQIAMIYRMDSAYRQADALLAAETSEGNLGDLRDLRPKRSPRDGAVAPLVASASDPKRTVAKAKVAQLVEREMLLDC